MASTPCGTTIFITPRWWRSPGATKLHYSDYLGKPQEFISIAVKYGFLYQGQRYSWQKQRRGSAGLHLQPASKVIFIQNHDQTAWRILRTVRAVTRWTDPGRLRAMTNPLAAGSSYAHAVSRAGIRIQQSISLLRRS